jgi:hypothetical protein
MKEARPSETGRYDDDLARVDQTIGLLKETQGRAKKDLLTF